MDRLIQSGASVNRRSSMFGTDAFTNWTPLHWAAYRNHEDVVANLLKCGADASAADRFGRSALCIAITGLAPDKRLETVRALLNGRANPNQPNNFGTTPLHLAALSDDAAIVRLLIATGAQVNAKDRDGTTPLHHAVLDRKNPHTTRLLLEHGAETGDPLPNGRTLESVLDPDEHGSELIDVVRQAQQRN